MVYAKWTKMKNLTRDIVRIFVCSHFCLLEDGEYIDFFNEAAIYCLSCKIVPSSTLQKEFFEEFREETKEADWSHRPEVEKRLTEFKQSVDATNDKVSTTLQSEMNAKVFNT